MQAENLTNGGYGNTYAFKFDDSNYKICLYTSGDNTNCKLSYIHGIALLSGVSDDSKKKAINYLLTLLKGAVILNTTSEKMADFIKNNYQVYYFEKVPIGYNSTYQYHMCIMNEQRVNENCKVPVRKETTS